MELKNCLIFSKSDEKGKVIIPREYIKSVQTKMQRDYASNSDKEVTYIMIDIDYADMMGIDTKHSYRHVKVIGIAVAEDLIQVMGMLGASKASTALFGTKDE